MIAGAIVCILACALVAAWLVRSWWRVTFGDLRPMSRADAQVRLYSTEARRVRREPTDRVA